MDQKERSKPYSHEFREPAVRLFREHRAEYRSEVAALRAVAENLGCSPDSLRVWARQAQRDAGESPGPTSAGKARIKELERKNRELRRDPEEGERVFCAGGARPPVSQMTNFIAQHRRMIGVEPICKLPPIALSTYRQRAAVARKPGRACARAKTAGAPCALRSRGSSRRTGGATAPGRCGAPCSGRVSPWRAAPWSG
jgi:transposase-like protein